MKNFASFLVCCFTAVAFAGVLPNQQDVEEFSEEPQHVRDTGIIDANDFLDAILESLRSSKNFIKKVDPVDLPFFSFEGMELSNAKITGLKNIYRSSNSTLRFTKDTLEIMAALGIRNVELDGNWAKKILLTWWKGTVNAVLDNMHIRIDVTVVDGKPDLRELKVTHFGDLRIRRVTGLSFVFNWLLKIILNGEVNQYRRKIINLLEMEGALFLKNTLHDYTQFPIATDLTEYLDVPVI